jgi:hypothetical protein
MSATRRTDGPDTRALLSTLWIVVMLNILARDIHEILRPGFLQEVIAGSVNGNPLTEGVVLAGGIGMSLQIAMILGSRVLPYRSNRRANIVIGAAAIGALVYFTAMATPDLDDLFFAAVEITALLAVVLTAWRWRGEVASVEASGHVHVDAATR